jgi:hypothetical protein
MQSRIPNRFKSNSALYAAAFIIAAFELSVVVLTRFPQVSEDYKAFYITRTSPCPPVGEGQAYKLGTKVSLAAAVSSNRTAYLGCGWHWREKDGTWTKGAVSKLHMRVTPPASNLLLKLDVAAYAGIRENQEVDVSVNGTHLTRWVLPSHQAQEVTALIPRELAQDGQLEIHFNPLHLVLPAEKGPSDREPRIGMFVKSFTISKSAN